MINKLSRSLVSVILLILFAVNAVAQIELGPHRFVTLPAPPLSVPTGLKIGLASPRFLGKVGGIAFDGEAQPDKGFIFTTLSLNYRPGPPDSQNLKIKFDDREVIVPIYDWQLIPIARYADSKNFACVTLFGNLNDRRKEKEVRRDGGRIINYHPELANTLVGLRLFQLDSLILDEYCTDLPRMKGEYIRGEGESVPDVAANKAAFFDFRDYLNDLMEAQSVFRSYVINDFGSDIRFGISGNSLRISGEPLYYFWNIDDREPLDMRERVEQELRAAASKPSFNAKAWLVQQVVQRMSEFTKDYDVERILESSSYYYDAGFLDHLKALYPLQTVEAWSQYLQQQTEADLKIVLVNIRQIMEDDRPVALKEISRQVSSRSESLRKINPAVWDTGVNVMRYAAFFRYCQHYWPQQWKSFIMQIRGVTKIPHSLETPTIVYYER